MIKHESFVPICQKDMKLLDRVFEAVTLKQFTKNIEKEVSEKEVVFSNIFPTKYNFIGDLFEIFAEVFFLIHQGDNRTGIFKYEPGKKSEDNGVDGFGIGIDGKPATVQVKYRSNTIETLKERDIKNFGFQSIVIYNVDKETKTNMVVFTNSSGMHYHTENNVFQNRIRTIDNVLISKMIDNNHCFWLAAKQLVADTISAKFNV